MFNFKLLFTLLYCLIIFLYSSLFLISPISICILFIPNFGFYIKNLYLSSLSFCIKQLLQIQLFANSVSLFEDIVSHSDEQNILISNHLTEFDFLIFTNIVNNIKNLFDFKLIFLSKKSIGYILSGLTMIGVFSKDILLSRNIIKDNNKLIHDANANLLFLYPEGTCFTTERKLSSDNYCNKNNLPCYKFHIYPRITGIKTILEHHKYNNIYDITIIYDTIRKKHYGIHHNLLYYLYNYKFPQKIYINVNKYKIGNIHNIHKQLENIYNNKDDFVKNFDININKFKPIKYNYFNGSVSFCIVTFIGFISFYFSLIYPNIRTFYLVELITYYFYLFFLY